jgi:hypothetical protein
VWRAVENDLTTGEQHLDPTNPATTTLIASQVATTLTNQIAVVTPPQDPRATDTRQLYIDTGPSIMTGWALAYADQILLTVKATAPATLATVQPHHLHTVTSISSYRNPISAPGRSRSPWVRVLTRFIDNVTAAAEPTIWTSLRARLLDQPPSPQDPELSDLMSPAELAELENLLAGDDQPATTPPQTPWLASLAETPLHPQQNGTRTQPAPTDRRRKRSWDNTQERSMRPHLTTATDPVPTDLPDQPPQIHWPSRNHDAAPGSPSNPLELTDPTPLMDPAELMGMFPATLITPTELANLADLFTHSGGPTTTSPQAPWLASLAEAPTNPVPTSPSRRNRQTQAQDTPLDPSPS